MNVKVQLISICTFLYLQFSTADECTCATGNVHVRSGAWTTHLILGTLPTDSCLAFKGQPSTVSGTHWANVDYHGQYQILTTLVRDLTLQPDVPQSSAAVNGMREHLRIISGHLRLFLVTCTFNMELLPDVTQRRTASNSFSLTKTTWIHTVPAAEARKDADHYIKLKLNKDGCEVKHINDVIGWSSFIFEKEAAHPIHEKERLSSKNSHERSSCISRI